MATNLKSNTLVEYGLITHVGDKTIDVLCRSKVDCTRCAQGKGCGGGILARWLGERQHELAVIYPSGFAPQVGQIAEFSLPANLIVKVAALTYGLPLLLLAGVLMIVHQFQLSELTNVLIGIVALVLGVITSRVWIRRDITSGRYRPLLLSIKHKQDEEISCDVASITRRQSSILK